MVGSELYRMQHQLTNYSRTTRINSKTMLRIGDYVVDKNNNYYKIGKTYLSPELRKMNICYFSISYNGANINVWSARDNFRICK